jgi:hypothetical protein
VDRQLKGEKVLDFIFYCILALPLVLTKRSESARVRALGILLFALWVVPALAVFYVPIVLVTAYAMLEGIWKKLGD